MKSAVHAKVLSEPQWTGIGVYTYNVLKALSPIDRGNEYVLFTNTLLVHRFDAPNFREKVVRFPKAWSYLSLLFELKRERFDLLGVLADLEERERSRTKGFERAEGFSWERTARETLAVFRRVADRRDRAKGA